MDSKADGEKKNEAETRNHADILLRGFSIMENGPDNDIRTAHHSSPWEGGQERRKALPADHNKNILFFFVFFVSTANI